MGLCMTLGGGAAWGGECWDAQVGGGWHYSRAGFSPSDSEPVHHRVPAVPFRRVFL